MTLCKNSFTEDTRSAANDGGWGDNVACMGRAKYNSFVGKHQGKRRDYFGGTSAEIWGRY
jgi:hypothetical protein